MRFAMKFAGPVIAAGVVAAALAAPAAAAETAEPTAVPKGCLVTKNMPYGQGAAKCTSERMKGKGYQVWIRCNHAKKKHFGAPERGGWSRAICPSARSVSHIGVVTVLGPSSH